MNSLPLIHRFHDPLPEQALVALGRKGVGLCLLTAAGFRVPPGFILTTHTQPFFADGSHPPAAFTHRLREEIAHLEAITDRRLGDATRPLLLAVRSGAPESMPGMMRSILGVGLNEDDLRSDDAPEFQRQAGILLRDTFPELFASSPPQAGDENQKSWPTPWKQLELAIRAVFASWNRSAAIDYRRRMQLDPSACTAVNIQVLEHVHFTGVLHTRHPDETQPHWMLAEYAPAEMGVVSGRATPTRLEFSYEAEKAEDWVASPGQPASETAPDVDRQQLIDALRKVAKKIDADERFFVGAADRHLRLGWDLEWGWRDNELVVFQVRPIARSRRLRQGMKTLAFSGRLLVKHSLAESLQHPTPLTWSLMRRLLAGDGALGRVYRRMGYRPGEQTHRGDYLQLVHGHIYADVDRVAQFFDCGIPFRYPEEFFDDVRTGLDSAPTQFDPNGCGPWFLLMLPVSLLRFLRVAWKAAPPVARIREQQQKVTAQAKHWVNGQRRWLEQPMDAEETSMHLHRAMQYAIEELPVDTMSWAMHAGLATQRLQRSLERAIGDAPQAMRIATEWIAQLTAWPVTASLAAQWLRENIIDRATFNRQFGHRGDAEWELGEATYRTAPAADDLLRSLALNRQRVSAREMFSRRQIHPNGTWFLKPAMANELSDNWITEQLGIACNRRTLRRLRHDAQRAVTLAASRELGRDVWLKAYDILRLWCHKLASHWQLDCRHPSDFFFLEWKEIEEPRAPNDRFATIAERRERWEHEWELVMPRTLSHQSTATIHAPSSPPWGVAPDSTRLHGSPLVPGKARGRIANLMSPPNSRLADGHGDDDTILVCPSLDTNLIPQILEARGVVTEQGGVLSHAAIVARQCGIPVIQLKRAGELLATGTWVRIDGSIGMVEIE